MTALRLFAISDGPEPFSCLSSLSFLSRVQRCYDGKPRITSQRSRDDGVSCSNPDARHDFNTNRWVAGRTHLTVHITPYDVGLHRTV
jgi:hypothetical protein